MIFIQSIHCISRVHCYACRNDASFRASLEKAFGKIKCPLGLPIGAQELPEKQISVAEKQQSNRCKYMPPTGERTRKCGCYEFDCPNPEIPLFEGKPHRALSKFCIPDKCKFFEKSGTP
jgi:hypothetical protein